MTARDGDSTPPQRPEMQENQYSPAASARELVRRARKAYLGSVDKTSGHPHVSLVTVATDHDGTPLLLISKLAVHTQNLLADARCSLLFDGTDARGDPLAGGRVTLIGAAQATASTTAKSRFLARHPEAEGYAGFADFAFYALAVERAHYIGGFGRIVSLAATDLLIDTVSAQAVIAGEHDIVSHMNDDHADAIQLYATVLAGATPGAWAMTGIDPEGFDLAEPSGATARIAFDAPIASPEDARRELVRLVGAARSQGAAN